MSGRLLARFLALVAGAWLAVTGAEETAGPPERIAWRKVPIELVLPVGEERLVHFPASVSVGVPASLGPLVRAQSVDGTVYLLAHEPFESQRVMVRELESGRVYLLDVAASNTEGQRHAVHVFVPRDEAEPDGAAASVARSLSRPGAPEHGYPTLVRFAAQQLYAPARLLRELPGVTRTPVRRDPVPLLRGGAVVATPLAAWRAGGLHVTAVKLVNGSGLARELDPRDLRGDWLAAAFQHNRLLPAGDEADTTAVYLISARPFEASL